MIRQAVVFLILASLYEVTSIRAAFAAEPAGQADARRGHKALTERSFNPPFWSKSAWDDLWKQWGDLKQPPERYAEAIADRYGLHPAPYPNNGYPMGMRQMIYLLKQTVGSDCMLCHGGSIMGQSYIGLGNASLDMQSLYEDLNAAEGRARATPFVFTHVRGTNEAGNMSVYLIAFRDADLKFRKPPVDLDMREQLCEDVPAWWGLKKKKTMYHTGGTSARSVRSLMQFMMHPLNGPEVFRQEEATFVDIQAYLLSLEPPRYPFPIDRPRADRGEHLFVKNCARCHGTYGPNGTYPNKVVAIDDIGTDRTRYDGISEKFGRYYNESWFAKEQAGWFTAGYQAQPTPGYQAPPLDGIWATAPYFHNGSAPTVYHVLNSKARPSIFMRSYRTDEEAYDPVKLGWKFQALDRGADPQAPALERRKVYDTSQRGRGNTGHTYGDHFSDEERAAIIEYLKTL